MRSDLFVIFVIFDILIKITIMLSVGILCVTYFVTSIAMPDPKTSDVRHIR